VNITLRTNKNCLKFLRNLQLKGECVDSQCHHWDYSCSVTHETSISCNHCTEWFNQ